MVEGESGSGPRFSSSGGEGSSSPAAGSKAIHYHEQEKLVEDAFSV